jgi:hypothetical protein
MPWWYSLFVHTTIQMLDLSFDQGRGGPHFSWYSGLSLFGKEDMGLMLRPVGTTADHPNVAGGFWEEEETHGSRLRRF